MVSVTILTKQSEDTLEKVLTSVRDFDEVILLDTGSSDNTLEIGKKFKNVTIKTSPFIGFGPLHNLAISYASNSWILSLDADEVLSEDLKDEILNLKLDPKCLYSIPFHNYFKGKWIKGCGWYPDRHIRLFHKEKTRFSEDAVHEKILIKELQEVKLNSPIFHYSYRTMSDFLRKMEFYTTLFAEQNIGKKKSSFSKALTHGFFAFIKSYLLKRGIFDGKEGYIISVYNAQTAYYKYLKLCELNAKNSSLS